MGYYIKLFFKLSVLMFVIYVLVSLALTGFFGFEGWGQLLTKAFFWSIFMSLFSVFVQHNAIARYKDWQYEGSFIGGHYSKTVTSTLDPERLFDLLKSDTERTYQLQQKSVQSLTFLTKGGWTTTKETTTISWERCEDDLYRYHITCRSRFLLNIIDDGKSLKHIEDIISKLNWHSISNQSQMT